MFAASLVQVMPVGVTLFRELRVVVVIADDGLSSGDGFRLGGQCLNEVFHRIGWAIKQRAVQIDLVQIGRTLLREVTVTINKAGQHGLAAQVDNFADLRRIKIALRLGVRFGTYENDLAVQCCDDIGFLGIVGVFGFLCCFRNGVDFTITVYGIGNSVRSIQLHTAAEDQHERCCER